MTLMFRFVGFSYLMLLVCLMCVFVMDLPTSNECNES